MISLKQDVFIFNIQNESRKETRVNNNIFGCLFNIYFINDTVAFGYVS